MADESFELEDGEVVGWVMNGPSLSAADIELRAQLREAALVLRHGGQPDLARLALGLVDADHGHAMWVLDDPVRGGAGGDFSADPVLFDAFRRKIRMRLVISLQQTGNNEHLISEAFPAMVLEAAQHSARLVQTYDIDGGGFGAVPASAAAVRSLEKQTFRAARGNDNDDDGITECSICSEEFVDGGQVTVSVMPCPSRVHKFHSDCISKWLTITACLLRVVYSYMTSEVIKDLQTGYGPLQSSVSSCLSPQVTAGQQGMQIIPARDSELDIDGNNKRWKRAAGQTAD